MVKQFAVVTLLALVAVGLQPLSSVSRGTISATERQFKGCPDGHAVQGIDFASRQVVCVPVADPWALESMQNQLANESSARLQGDEVLRQRLDTIHGGAVAYSVEASTAVDVPTQVVTVLTLQVPAGKYALYGNVTVHNFATRTLPINCYLGSPVEFSVPYSARIDPFRSSDAGGASSTTIALTMTTEFGAPAELTLSCQSNTGTSEVGFATSRQLVAVALTDLTETDLAP
jgi:hypothetical protein